MCSNNMIYNKNKILAKKKLSICMHERGGGDRSYKRAGKKKFNNRLTE